MLKRYYASLDIDTGGGTPGLSVFLSMSPSSPVSSATLTATVSGGVTPYTYNFTVTTTGGGGGTGHVSTPNQTTSSTTASTLFIVPVGTGYTYTCACKVTDSTTIFVNSNVVYDGPM